MTAKEVATYMAIAGCTRPECMQNYDFTYDRLMNMVFIAQGLSFARDAYLFTKNMYLTYEGVRTERISEKDKYVDEDGYVRPPVATKFYPRSHFSGDERELCRDVLQIFRDWTNDELWDFVQGILPPVVFTRLAEHHGRVELEPELLRACFAHYAINAWAAEDGEHVTMVLKTGDGEVTPLSSLKQRHTEEQSTERTGKASENVRENTDCRYCRRKWGRCR